MNNQLREAIEAKKQYYIEKLLDAGIYKVSNRQLYRLTLSELERIFQITARQSHG
ncbi:Fur-regulated basic protein FbpA [Scopulibacillus cellulosilyticus]|uniref:Fur-regulated basic protein FbpA n=1 Tax=Scopulibacillus cellulosilyticus TaxID=2665665 RepID=A0ABW2PUR4_9BACL